MPAEGPHVPSADPAAAEAVAVQARGHAAAPADGSAALSLHTALSALLGLVVTVIWGVTGQGYFWPAWVWLGLGIALAGHAGLRWALALPTAGLRALGVVGLVTAVATVAEVAVWALAGGGFFWPAFPILGSATATTVLALVVFRHRLWPSRREQELEERVDELTRSRRGALAVQAAELRRIERDLHDGAQARLVALSIQLGRAEERLSDRPLEAELIRRARAEASTAIAELRDLARGIAPPVLADRGLTAAVAALGRRSPMPVTVAARLDRRPAPVVEAAAYFVVAEALTNVAKHTGGAAGRVTIAQKAERLIVEVADEGPGNADPDGRGLTGLRHRVEALDGTLTVVSEPDRGTTIRAELPCAW
jgi:signal transduction histidine kinase